ncbi:MAG: Gfo/Idh/MocA family oxidoreductase [Nitrososphaerota archaeon]|nr:Gfo/Idh/MocA family oxidoreductase [Candidatus Bathyarchaeota archaeon]MCX8162896.1 Gfo/Idh/MocA family oxidoreductase [Candidatus Bathyarchaeota archaeon]MDW8061539.1 Gfo/Idh/MocA family oxidoreductase [Nitrososphaerota archaeon]
MSVSGVPSLREIGVGVVGLGNIGVTHVRAFMNVKGAKLVAVVDTLRERADSIAKMYGVKSYYTLEDLLRDSEIELVSIATPSYLHAPQAIYAMEYGKHVIVEKPMDITLRGAKTMIERARKNGVKLGVVFQQRFADDVQYLKKLIDEGALGKLFFLSAEMMWWRSEKDYYFKDELARSWRGLWLTEGGGAITNQGIHYVDLLIWLGGGRVEEVIGLIDRLTHPNIEVEDIALGMFRYMGGHLGNIVATVSVQPQDAQYTKIKVFGDEGYAEIHDRNLAVLKTVKGVEAGVKKVEEGAKETLRQPPTLHQKMFQSFVDALLEDRDFPIPGEEGIKSLEVIKAIYLSSKLGQRMKLPLDIDMVI